MSKNVCTGQNNPLWTCMTTLPMMVYSFFEFLLLSRIVLFFPCYLSFSKTSSWHNVIRSNSLSNWTLHQIKTGIKKPVVLSPVVFLVWTLALLFWITRLTGCLQPEAGMLRVFPKGWSKLQGYVVSPFTCEQEVNCISTAKIRISCITLPQSQPFPSFKKQIH